MRPVSAVLIGAGGRGWAYSNYALDHPGKLKMVGVAEPIEEIRIGFVAKHKIPAENVFETWEDIFVREKIADAVFICTQDRMHFEPAMAAISKGYNILLEKPISPVPEECLKLAEEAETKGVRVIVCHVLRYAPFFVKIKTIIDSGEIGNVVSITHNENVGFMHHAHSFVRGNWRNVAESSPMILAKSCHDTDIIQWLIGKKCLRLSSFGSLYHFNENNCPEDAPKRCTDRCQHDCIYDARKWYLLDGVNNLYAKNWFAPAVTKSIDPTNERILNALKTGPYGRCVYKCDNDVVDHQVTNMEFEGGITAAFTMCAFTHDISRTIKIMGTKGELRGHMEKNSIIIHEFGTSTEKELITLSDEGHVGHGGGDTAMMEAFCDYINGNYRGNSLSEIRISADNHMISFAAEESRLAGGKVVELT